MKQFVCIVFLSWDLLHLVNEKRTALERQREREKRKRILVKNSDSERVLIVIVQYDCNNATKIKVNRYYLSIPWVSSVETNLSVRTFFRFFGRTTRHSKKKGNEHILHFNVCLSVWMCIQVIKTRNTWTKCVLFSRITVTIRTRTDTFKY